MPYGAPGFFNQFSNTGANAFGNYIGALGNYAGSAASADASRLNASVNSQGNILQAQTQQQGNLLNRLSAYERNYVDHDLGLKGNETNRYGIDTGRQTALDQIASGDRQ